MFDQKCKERSGDIAKDRPCRIDFDAGLKLVSAGAAGLIRGVSELLCPPRCFICGTDLLATAARHLCSACLAQFDWLTSPLCPRCGRQFETSGSSADRHCGDCLAAEPGFDTARSLAWYRPPLTDLLQRFKYRAEPGAIGALAEVIALGRDYWPHRECDLVVPVPLHRRRLRQRGFNQALFLARLAFPQYRGGLVPDALVRTRDTEPQTGQSGARRRANLRGAFRVKKPGLVRGKKVWLVDDVYTTGTTVAACAASLKEDGAATVQVWTVARA